MCRQYVHKNPMRIVPTTPISNPAFRKASGIARIPVPRLHFKRCIKVSPFLEQQTYNTINK